MIVSILTSLSQVRVARLAHAIVIVVEGGLTRVVIGRVRVAELFGEPISHGSDGTVLAVACGLEIFNTSQGSSLLERLLVAATLIILTILLRLGICEALRLVDHGVLVMERVLRQVRPLRFLRLLGLAAGDGALAS